MKCWISIFILALSPILIAAQEYFIAQPIYHLNGHLATSGDSRTAFYHDDGQICYLGTLGVDQTVYYKNGAVAWLGTETIEEYSSYKNCAVYHNNGVKAWKGVRYQDTSFSLDPSSVFHSDGSIAWRGALYKDSLWGTTSCALYYRNGRTAWKGATKKECSYYLDPCTVYHSNGAAAWRGSFSHENLNTYASGVFHDNGQLAWGGRSGDPILDRNGYLVTAAAEAMNLPLGEGSWLYISYNGYACVHLNLGNESYLTVTNQDENPRLLMNLGPGLSLECFPYTLNAPQITVYDTIFPIR